MIKKKACFNCTGLAHRASECRSTTKCKNCGKRHHTTICGETEQPKPALAAHKEEDEQVIYPTVLVEIHGVKAHALLDTGAGSSYASAKLIDATNKKSKQVMARRVDMILSSTATKVEIYSANLKSIEGKFDMDIELCKVHRPQLMTINHPNFTGLCEKYSHLEGVKVNEDPQNRDQIPILVVLDASEYAAVKTRAAQRVGLPGQPDIQFYRQTNWVARNGFGHLIQRLKRNDLYEEYNTIIKEQLEQGIIEAAPEAPTGSFTSLTKRW